MKMNRDIFSNFDLDFFGKKFFDDPFFNDDGFFSNRDKLFGNDFDDFELDSFNRFGTKSNETVYSQQTIIKNGKKVTKTIKRTRDRNGQIKEEVTE